MFLGEIEREGGEGRGGGRGGGGALSNLSRRRPSYVSGQLDESSSKCKELYSLLRTNRAKTS